MGRALKVVHRNSIIYWSQFHLDSLSWLCRIASMVGRADVPVHILATVETILNLLALFRSALYIISCLLEVFMHDILFLEISELTNAIIFKLWS